jgi:hypothetical protein
LERVLILAFFLVISEPVWGLWILAIATQVTALHRVLHVWNVTRQGDASS